MSSGETLPPTSIHATPAGAHVPLRVVLVAPEQAPGWIRSFQRLARENEWIDLSVVVVPGAELPLVRGVGADLRAFLACERVARRHPAVSLAMEPLLRDSTAVAVDAVAGEQIAPVSLQARVSAMAPHLVLLLGPEKWASTLAAQTPWGCWHVDSSLTDPRHAGLSLMAPMLQGQAVTRTQLVLQGRNREPLALAGSWGRTRAASFLMQRDYAFRKVPALLLRALRRVAAGNLNATRRDAATLQLQAPQKALGPAAGTRALARILTSATRSLVAKARKRNDQWMVTLRQGGALLDPDAPATGSNAILKPPRGWWADPCVVAAEGRKLVFVEEVADPETNKGTIACVELVGGAARRLGLALEEPGHLSFPQAFRWEGRWYMTVESSYARRISLYRATSFPLEWVRIRDLVTGRRCVDPTLHHYEGYWYLFASVSEVDDCDYDELFLFVADTLEGPFRPHPASPVVEDVRRARLAGRLFQDGGRLIRPAQECAPRYGRAVVFNEVLELSPTVYRERMLSRLAADWSVSLDGCHTYSVAGSTELLDVRGQPPRGAAFLPMIQDSGIVAPAARVSVRGLSPPAVEAPKSNRGVIPADDESR